MRLFSRLFAVLLGAALCAASSAGVLLEPTESPAWKIDQWLNDDPGKIADHRGKVILIHFFQMWCPGCDDFSIPLFQRWTEEFGARDDVLVVSIHTVFEGHDVQSPEHLRLFVAERGIAHPVGIDAYPSPGARVPITMDRFETGGTPHIAIVDQQGKLRFSHFGRFEPDPVERFITRLLDEDEAKTLNIKSSPRKTEEPGRKSRRTPPAAASREPEPPPTEPAEAPSTPDAPDRETSGSYKLRFEAVSRSCGESGPPVEVITQVSVYDDRIEAKFSRAYLGLRSLTATYDPGSGHFQADLQQQGQEKGGVAVDLGMQLTGRLIIGGDAPELEYDYYLDKSSADGELDCVIEGRGGGARFRKR
jgi:thiol-disulfide isomerase/thioredoxin